MGRKGLQQHLQDRGPRQPRARRHRQGARSDERTGVQHVQGRTAAHARLRLRMGLPALRRHSLHRSRAGAGRQLHPHAARRSHRQDSQRGSQRRDARLPAAAAQQGDLRFDPSGPRGRLRTQSPHLPELGILRRGRQIRRQGAHAGQGCRLRPRTLRYALLRRRLHQGRTQCDEPLRPERPRQQRRMDLGLAVQRHDIGQPAQRRILRRTAHRRRLLLFQPHADVHRRDPVHRRQIDRRIAAVRLQGALEKPRSPSRPLLRAAGFARAGNAVRN